jgi:hypothetical protein
LLQYSTANQKHHQGPEESVDEKIGEVWKDIIHYQKYEFYNDENDEESEIMKS